MSFDELLTDLLERVDGALSATIVDGEGEMVATVCRDGVDRHTALLIGAYESIFHRRIEDVLDLTDCRSPSCHFVCYRDGIVLTCPLVDGYFLTLHCALDCNIGQGIKRLRETREMVISEM